MEVPMTIGQTASGFGVSSEQREQLESFANSRSLPSGLVSRAKITFLSASG
jgi:hypothetical protein